MNRSPISVLLALTTLAGGPASAGAQDPRVGLRPGRTDAGEAAWNLRVLSATRSPAEFEGGINSDLAFFDHYAIQGSFRGYQIWDISDPSRPTLRKGFVCPA